MSDGPGRPTVVTEIVILELIKCFHDGLNVQQACWQAGISKDAYYDAYNSSIEFADKMNRARQFLSMNARGKISEAILKGDMKTARWYVERRDKDEFSARTELTGRGGKPLIQGLDPEEKERLDKIWARKHGTNNDTTSESTPGNDQSTDQPGGGNES